MKLYVITLMAILVVNTATAQPDYTTNLKAFQANYVSSHEVVKGKDKKYFRFFPIDSTYRINSVFEKLEDSVGFTMKTSGTVTKQYYKYGKVLFTLKDTILQLFIYQSKDLMKTAEYKNYLFIPFTDGTTGDESYGSGRYMDFTTDSIQSNRLTLDFNKAYNPYCAYATGFHCPLPPRENFLKVAIIAGEKVFGKAIH